MAAMNFLSRIFTKKAAPTPLDAWPNQPTWGALKSETSIQTTDGPWFLWTVACGDLMLPSGRLAACDPFVFLEPGGMPFVSAPKGNFPVVVTMADVSNEQNRSQLREAYASIIFSTAKETSRKVLAPAKEGEPAPKLSGDEFVGFGVDAGTACFVDESVIGRCMPDPQTWYTDLFDNDRADCWFKLMDDSTHIRAGIANIKLPLGAAGENLILFHSGWGDGFYPLIGSFDSENRLVAVHIDFLVVR
jgi:hypothetical protein